MTNSPTTPPICALQPIDLNNPNEHQRLQSQRRKCGWDFEDTHLNRWRDQAITGTKNLFWITTSPPAPASPSPILAGHISLDSLSSDHPNELAKIDKSLLTISTFFILPAFRAKGLGREALRQLETLARQEPYGSAACSALTIMSLSSAYVEDGALRALYVEWTGEEPLSFERWYARMGYVKWKEEACTEVVRRDGEVLMLVEVFMKKVLRGGE
ncbi:hypothetical protein Q7P37_007135 [Cladosporium fusiforme]